MKKIMILAAVVCAAVVSQAAAINWTVTGNGSSQKSKAVYIFESSSRSAIVALLEAGTSTGTAAGILSDATWTGAVKANGQTSSATTPGAEGSIDLGEVATGNKSYFAVVFNKTEALAADATKYYLSADATGHSYTDLNPGEGVAVAMSIAGVTAVTIPTQAVPEPTSAMLLLLGVAGMALRRRRA